MSGSDSDRMAVRRRRLIVELGDEGVELIEEILTRDADLESPPDGTLSTAEAAEVEELLLDELTYARNPPVHEGRRPSYGAIVVSGADIDPDIANDLRMLEPAGDSPVEDLRELANGITTFVVRSDAEHGLAVIDRGDELSLMRLCNEHNCWVVQRHPSGTVKIFGRERLHIFENDAWLTRPYAHTRWMQLMHGTATSGLVGSRILDFCLHVLSARHIGATIVWMTGDPDEGLDAHLARSMRPTGVELNITETDHTEALASLLASVDGACILDHDGKIVGLEAFLKSGDDAERHVSHAGGTRHNSAARFSFDVAEAVVFVVSADGPVTVFSDGADLLRLDAIDPSAARVETIMPEIYEQVSRTVKHVVCPTCGKRIICEREFVEGWTAGDSADCPVCGHESIDSAECFHITTRVAKPWEGEDVGATWGFP